jgi:hypothetical protein
MNKINFYEPIYNRIEKDVIDLTFQITFDDNQIGVYSPRIVDLILQAALQIEAITTTLYEQTVKTDDPIVKAEYKNVLRMDYQAGLKKIVEYRHLSNKKVIIVRPDIIYFEFDHLKPFEDWQKDWNHAYQKLKHNLHDECEDKRHSLNLHMYGTIGYLIKITAALFVLNQELKDNQVPDSQVVNNDVVGSGLFGLEVDKSNGEKVIRRNVGGLTLVG